MSCPYNGGRYPAQLTEKHFCRAAMQGYLMLADTYRAFTVRGSLFGRSNRDLTAITAFYRYEYRLDINCCSEHKTP